MVLVGTSQADSKEAVEFAAAHDGTWAAVGVHPHEAKDGWDGLPELANSKGSKVVAIGEIGLDYHYSHSPKAVQIEALEAQIDIALRANLPIIFHVRDASSAERRTSVWNDFWPIFDNFSGVRGVLHSFTDTVDNLEKGMSRGLYVGVNGISTFTKDPAQQEMYKNIPLKRMLLETDAPFLTPSPLRGKVNEPAFVREVAKHQAEVKSLPLEVIIATTTANAEALFTLQTKQRKM